MLTLVGNNIWYMARAFFLPLFFFLSVATLMGQTTIRVVGDSTAAPVRPVRSGLQIAGETTICPGTITALKVEGEYAHYEWDTGQETPNLTVYKPGTYTVTVTTAGGCHLTGSVTVRYATGPCL